MTDATTRERLLERVRKVLAYTKSENENELAAAWGRVHVMLAEHNLTMEEVGALPHDDMGMGSVQTTKCEPWRRNIGSMVGQMYFCIYFYHDAPEYGKPKNRVDVHYMAGEVHNVKVAAIMFNYVCNTIEALAKEAIDKLPPKVGRSGTNRKKYRETFIDACANRVCIRIKERIDAAKRGSAQDWHGNTLPVLASEYDRKLLEAKNFMDQQYGMSDNAKKEVNLPVITDMRGLREGVAAGNKIGLDTQVGHTSQKRLN